jgi:hypothetical protein
LNNRYNEVDNLAAIEILERASRRPRICLQSRQLAQAYVNRFPFYAPGEQKQLEPKASAAAERALALDSELGAPTWRAGCCLTLRTALPTQAAQSSWALALNPNLDEAHMQLARVYVHTGFLGEAIDEAGRPCLNPSSVAAPHHRAEAPCFRASIKKPWPIGRLWPDCG